MPLMVPPAQVVPPMTVIVAAPVSVPLEVE